MDFARANLTADSCDDPASRLHQGLIELLHPWLFLFVAESDPPSVTAVLTSGDINAIYDEQLLNPPPPESVSQSLVNRLAGWLPRRWAKVINGNGRNAS